MAEISEIVQIGREPDPTPANRRAVVIGGGVAGLAAAYYLKKRGVAVDLIEREGVVGGMARSSLREDRYICELGPCCFRPTDAAIAGLARELSIDPQIVGIEDRGSTTAIRAAGITAPMPLQAAALSKSPLLTRSGKARALIAPLIPSRPRPGMSVAAYVKQRLGQQAWERLFEPGFAGAFGGGTEELELQSAAPGLVRVGRGLEALLRAAAGSGIRASGEGALSFKWGMGTLSARLEEVLRGSTITHSTCTAIERRDGNRFRLQVEGDLFGIDADAVVVATPAPAAAAILSGVCPRAARALAEIRYQPMAVVHASFPGNALPRDRDLAEYLGARDERRGLLSATRITRLFPWRAPSGEELIACTLGGEALPRVAEMEDSELVAAAMEGLRSIMGIEAKPRFTFVRRWPQAVPLYALGHRSRIEAIEAALDGAPGLFATGNYYAGISVSDTIAHARETAKRVLAFLKG